MAQPLRPRRKSRTRPRRKVNWVSTFTILIIGNLIFASFRSGVTAVRAINLDGVRKSERLRLDRMVEQIKGRPALTIDPRVVEANFMNETRVKSADFRRNIFGIARLILQYREPVASIAGSKNTYLDSAGVVFMDPEVALHPDKTLPSVALDPKIRVSAMTMAGLINYRSVSQLCEIVRVELSNSNKTDVPIEIQVQESGGVCLNINNGTVDLGTFEHLAEKIQKLRQTLQEQPNVFDENSSINLMVPENPQRVPRKKENG